MPDIPLLSTSVDEYLENRTFDEPLAGETASLSHTVTQRDIDLFAAVSGNMMSKEFTFLAGAEAAGIVLGASVPIILTSRADSIATKVASAHAACSWRGRNHLDWLDPGAERNRHRFGTSETDR